LNFEFKIRKGRGVDLKIIEKIKRPSEYKKKSSIALINNLHVTS